MKKSLLRIMILALIFSLVPIQTCATNSLSISDMKTHWAKDSINKAIAQGWVNGYEDHTFKPNRSVSRQEFIKIIISALGYQVNIAGTDWHVPYVEKAVYEQVITQNYYKKLLDQELGKTPITRGEVTQILYQAYVQNGDIEMVVQSNPLFNDKIPSHLATAVATLVNAGVITGYPDNTFRYAQGITRAEAVVVIERLLKLIDEDEPPKDGISINEMMSAITQTIPLSADMIEMSGLKEKSGKDVATMDDFYRVVGAYFGFDKTYVPKYVARVPKLINPQEAKSYEGGEGLNKAYMDEKLLRVQHILAKEKALEPVTEKLEASFYNDKGNVHMEILGADREKYDLFIYIGWKGGEWVGQTLYDGFENATIDFSQQYGEINIYVTEILDESAPVKSYRVDLPGGKLQDTTFEYFMEFYKATSHSKDR